MTEPKYKQTIVRKMPESLHRRLKIQAYKEGISLQALVVKCCRFYMNYIEDQDSK